MFFARIMKERRNIKNLNCIDEEKGDATSVVESVTNLNLSTKDTHTNHHNNRNRT